MSRLRFFEINNNKKTNLEIATYYKHPWIVRMLSFICLLVSVEIMIKKIMNNIGITNMSG